MGFANFGERGEEVNGGQPLPARAAGLLVGAQALGGVVASLPCVVGALLARWGRRPVFAGAGPPKARELPRSVLEWNA